MRVQKRNQNGFASIVIALVMVLVLSLLTIAFAQMARREQKSALDKQLATQAYYAAESGVNDVLNKLATLKTMSVDKNTCLSTADLNTLNIKPDINKNNGISYSCILADVDPSTLEFTKIEPGDEKALKFSVEGWANGEFDVNWGSATGKNAAQPASSGTKFLPKASWGNSYGVLQVSITYFSAPIQRDDLVSNTFTTYLYPGGAGASSANTVGFTTDRAQQGKIVRSTCSASGEYPCSVKITGIQSAEKYLIRILSFYDSSNVQIANPTAAGVPYTFSEGQVAVDVTGRARDVLKRISVRAPIEPISDLPEDALSGQTICKRSLTEPSTTTPDSLAGCDPDSNP